MSIFDGRTAYDSLTDVLDRESQAVLTGDFARLTRLADEKERMLRAVSKMPVDGQRLAGLRKHFERNQDLLQAAARGIRAASARLTAPPEVTLQTYDNAGRRSTAATGSVSMERRA
jgi:flagellar biosynthesis/type III secretory pathway chaperone